MHRSCYHVPSSWRPPGQAVFFAPAAWRFFAPSSLAAAFYSAMLALNAPLHGAYLGLPILRYLLLGLAAGIVLLELLLRTPYPKQGTDYLIHAEFSGAAVNLRGFFGYRQPAAKPRRAFRHHRGAQRAGSALLEQIERHALPSFSCRTASGESSLPGFLPDKLIITTRDKSYAAKAYLALADTSFPEGYTALLGPNLKLFPL